MNGLSLEGLEVEDAEGSLALICSALNGVNDDRSEKAAEMIALNAGAAIYVAGVADSISEGVELARGVISDGSGWKRLKQLARLTNEFVE
jgi:anthranilate phosphoribosyltransferase